tara:strand:+ start:5260 stop:8082 length:2823 start_codon:yes stop_codon:yes gene_type:complete
MDFGELLKALNLDPYIALDFETTGFDPASDKIIEVAAVRFEGGEVSDSFSSLVNPGRAIPEFIVNLTGISDDMVADSPDEKEVVPKLAGFIGDDPIVAHNISFDYSFYSFLTSKYLPKTELKNRLCDTLSLSQSCLYFLPNHRLGTVTNFFGYQQDAAHRAMSDTENCGHIFVNLIKELASYPIEPLQKLISILKPFKNIPNKDIIIDLVNLYLEKEISKAGIYNSEIEKNVKSNRIRFTGSSSLSGVTAEDVFTMNGKIENKIESFDLFEERLGQVQYSQFIDDSFENGNIAVAEAGTGLGKSLAYLFPAVKHATDKDTGPVVISCNTKHLQDQLFYQEVPKLAKMLDISFRACTVKGRRNYICKTRLNRLIEDSREYLSPYEAESLLPLITWMHFTKTGDFSECPGFLNRQSKRVKMIVCSDVGFCTTNVCDQNNGCFLGPLRQASLKSDILIVNHSLLLSDSASGMVLPPFELLIIDEAHNLIKTAYGQYQVQLNFQLIQDQLKPAIQKNKMVQKIDGIGKKYSVPYPELTEYMGEIKKLFESIIDGSKDLFKRLESKWKEKFNPKQKYPEKFIYHDFQSIFSEEKSMIEILSHDFLKCKSIIKDVASLINESKLDKTEIETLNRFFIQYGDILVDIENKINATLIGEKDDWVYWVEGIYYSEKLFLSLNGVKIDIGETLTDSILNRSHSVVLTSATLNVNNDFDYFKTRCRLDLISEGKSVCTESFSSPFMYEEQCKYFQWVGDVDVRSHEYSALLADLIYHLSTKGKRTILLFTARSAIQSCYDQLKVKAGFKELNVFAQIGQTSRNALLEGLKKSENGILLGTSSFWEGIDLPGELLQILVVTKLPFDVPTEPIVKAYSGVITSQGGNSFYDFTVPETATRLRQGFGRLIRSTYDDGVFINMDNRVVTKGYGRQFQEIIPVRMQPFSNIYDLNI